MTTPDKRTFTRAVFYFRTLERWPGGNADMLTIKVTMRLAPGAAPELEAQFYSCFDGNHAWYPPRRVEIDAGDALDSFLEVARSLAARGPQTLVVRPQDHADDEWDCEWGESEVYLYTTDDGPDTRDAASLRLLRQPMKSRPSAPDPELERAFELAGQLTGVGRVFEFANTKDALSAAYRAQGNEATDLDHVLVRTPTYLPPGTDTAFVEAQAKAAKKRAAGLAKAAQQAKKAAARAPQRASMLVFRLDELPALLSRELSSDASARQCVFFIAGPDDQAVDALMREVPEDEHDETETALDIASRLTGVLAQSDDYRRWLSPDASRAGGENFGFHGSDPDAVERWLDEHGIERLSPRPFLDQIVLLRLVDEDGEPLEQVDKLTDGLPGRMHRSIGDGLYAFPRDPDHARFELSRVLEEELDDSDVSWVELHASELPPGEVHTVTVPVGPASGERASEPAARAKKAAGKQTGTKKAAATQIARSPSGAKRAARQQTATKQAAGKSTATKQTAAKTAGAMQIAAKQTPAKTAAAKQTATKKAAAEQTPARTATKKAAAKKTTARKTAARQAPAKTTAKKAAAKKTTAKKIAARQAPAKTTAKKAAAKKTTATKTTTKKQR